MCIRDSSLDGLDDDATLAVVSHGAVLRLWVTSQCENLTPQEVRRRRIPNTTVLTLEGRPGAWRFVAWDEPRLLDLAADDPTANADED